MIWDIIMSSRNATQPMESNVVSVQKGHEWLCCIQSQIQGKQDELRKVRRNVMYKFGCHVLSNAKEAMYIDQTKLYQQERLKA